MGWLPREAKNDECQVEALSSKKTAEEPLPQARPEQGQERESHRARSRLVSKKNIR